MPPVVRICAIVLAGVILTLGIAWLVLFHTPPGQAFVKRQVESSVERIIENSFDSKIKIGAISGNLPGQFTLSDIQVYTDATVWFRAGRIDLDWSPMALIRQRVVIESLEIADAQLLQRPPMGTTAPKSDSGFSLPSRLPWLEVEKLSLEKLSVADGIWGGAREFSGAGRFSTARGKVEADLRIDTADRSDDLTLIVLSDRRNLRVNIAAASSADGLLAWALREDAPVSFSLAGEGPLQAWTGSLNAASDNYGQYDIDLSGSFTGQPQLSVRGNAVPGDRLPSVLKQAIGDDLKINVALTSDDQGYDLTIDRVAGFFGTVSGTINDMDMTSSDRTAKADLTLTFSDAYLSDRGAFLAGTNRISGTIIQREGAITAVAKIDTPVASIGVEELRFNQADGLQTDLVVDIREMPDDGGVLGRIFQSGAEVRTRLNLIGNLLAWENLAGKAENSDSVPALSIAGGGSFNLQSRALRHKGVVEVSPALLRDFLPAVDMTDGISADLELAGTPGAISINTSGGYGDWQLSDKALSSGQFTAVLTGVPTSPAGTINLTSLADDHQARVDIKSPGADRLLFDDISLTLDGLSATGNVLHEQSTNRLAVNLDLIATDENWILPNGRALAGDISLAADIGMASGVGQPLKISIQSSQLQIDRARLEDLSLQARGNSDRIQVDLSGRNFSLPGNQFFSQLESAAVFERTADKGMLMISSFEAEPAAAGATGALRLARPARLVFESGNVQLGEMRLDYGDDTTLKVAGQYTPQNVLIDATGQNILLPFLEAPLSFDIAIDTEAIEPGRITIAGSVQENGLQHAVRVINRWDGRNVTTDAVLTNGGGAVAGQLTVAWPLIMQKTDRLRIGSGDGQLVGQLAYDDKLSPLLAFLPLDTDLVEGKAKADVRITGTIEQPSVTGSVELEEGRYEERNIGALISDIAGRLEFSVSNQGSEGTFRFAGSDAEGMQNRIDLSGRVVLGRTQEGDISVVDGRLILDRATIIKSRDLTASASSDLVLTGSLSDMTLSGTVDMRKVDAIIPTNERKKKYTPVRVVRVDDGGQVVSSTNRNGSRLLSLGFDVEVRAADEVFISGRGLQSEWKGQINLAGSASKPRLTGEVESVKGTLDFAGRKFEISRGRISFRGAEDQEADLDIVAEYDADTDQGTIQTLVSVSGSARNPSIEISSIPSLPQDQVMALILFGKDPSDLSAFETLRIAEAITELSGSGLIGGEGVTGTIRRIGLDALNFGQDATTGAGTVSIGKYVSDDVFVSATQGIGAQGSVSVTYDINDTVSVETSLEEDGSQSVSANYKRDY